MKDKVDANKVGVIETYNRVESLCDYEMWDGSLKDTPFLHPTQKPLKLNKNLTIRAALSILRPQPSGSPVVLQNSK
ncbi:MAG: hypothetical protein HQL32_16085 [Planctomycetes bacterium]|nr:hypothetical protein [Planctomycetota bacterium]